MSRQFDHLADVEVFLIVAEKLSISATAIHLSTTPSVISRTITRLEKKLGIQFFRRTTRHLRLTEAGQLYYEKMQHAFQLIDHAERVVQGEQLQISGKIKLSVPTTYGHYRLPPLLEKFLLQYPDIQIEISISNRNVDLIAEGFDLAIRQGHLPNSSLVARPLELAPLQLVASPNYLKRVGIPQSLEELNHHQCIAFELPSSGKITPWFFKDVDQEIQWTPTNRILVKEDILGVVSLAESGLGICQSYSFIVNEKIRQGKLLPLLEAYAGHTRPFSLLYAQHKHMSSATRALINFLCSDGE
ncbi:LysR family transcriptional regulator [Acinetobacter calcoaceticus]|uniref:LysR family transcriptional regulator n=1 Tax=Acinetobacter calcoaceticus TaxID=471 RepID=UPI0005E70A73|nr:LysR family transcriptional regulator [Acinetobacter calcoaceticus]KJH62388.1 LuxR family transcriptional regulator [Acinetobacter calcoaceticus]WNY30594.1 LysR family transcriptional regulator [Acinetobacter calcoaceticus]